MKDKLTLDDCLKLYEEEGIMGLVEKVKELSFKAGQKEVVEFVEHNLNAEYCAVPFPLTNPKETKSMMCMDLAVWNNFWEKLRKFS